MSTQRFVDALSGADGTQALRVRYEVLPVYPDATVPVAPVRPPLAVRATAPGLPEIDPRVAAAVRELAAIDRPAAARAQPRERAPRPPAAAEPSRRAAARAGFHQGPTPTAIAPAAPSTHRRSAAPSFPVPAAPAGTVPSAADRFRGQLTQFGQQFGTGNVRTPPAAPSSPQAGPRSSVPASAFQPPAPPQRLDRRRANLVQLGLFLLFFFLVVTGLGADIVQAVVDLLDR
ncbi:hypothetical protein [Nakamurella deserti]|uniref:hypothetical protein n=1 Tax=Nakamurella deserti TaxID=2164074 RepID=UPI000DBE154C|nr:hypothetical protein [Nakamurella deserti]